MSLTTLASLIAALTHQIDRLEVFLATPICTCAAQERHDTLAFEVIGLHALLAAMNAAYVELEDKTLDHAFDAMD